MRGNISQECFFIYNSFQEKGWLLCCTSESNITLCFFRDDLMEQDESIPEEYLYYSMWDMQYSKQVGANSDLKSRFFLSIFNGFGVRTAIKRGIIVAYPW